MPRMNDDVAANREFYESLWPGMRVRDPERFNTWPLVSEIAAGAPARLEIGPGMSPRLPIRGTHFLDLSDTVARRLAGLGGDAKAGRATALPFPVAAFDLVGAFDVVEHVADDEAVFSEIARVLKPGGALLLSVPLHADRWTEFDAAVGHHRRYDPEALSGILERHGLRVERSAPFGMQPKSRFLLKMGIWWLRHRTRAAVFFYDRIILPIACRLQRPLRLHPGMIDPDRADEVLLVCRRAPAGPAAG